MKTCLVFLASVVLTACASSAINPEPKIVLLGEVHDNPDGHRRRYEDLLRRVEAGWRPALVMEQFDRESQAALSKARNSCADADCVIRSAGGRRWEWVHYRPLLELALRYRLPLIAANVSRADALGVMKGGFNAAFDQETIAAFGLAASLPPELLRLQGVAIESGHCGMLPPSMVPGMVNAQIARDVWMAHALLKNAETGAVLIAGNGHVRRDVGVPQWLAVRGRKDVQVLGFVEQASPSDRLAYDVTHLIAEHRRPDPCRSFTPPAKPSTSG